MTLEGAINFNDTNDYTIYTMNSASAGQYCVVLPKNNNGMYNMLVDLHMKSLFDGVSSGTKAKDDLVKEIGSEYGNIKSKYNDAILVMPMLDDNSYINIINTADKQKMFDEVKKIGAITSELYKKLIDGGIDKSRIDQKIIIIEKDDYDKKFVEWLVCQMPNFVSGVSISEFSVNDNLFMAGNNSTVNDIFGAPVVDNANVGTPVVDNTNINNEATSVLEESVQESVVESQPEIPDIFGGQVQSTPDVSGPEVQPNVVVEQPVQNLVQQPVQDSVQQPAQNLVQQPVVDGVSVEPKPIQSVGLDQTVTLSPVNDAGGVQAANPEAKMEDGYTDNVGSPKKSNGFVNLAILLVVLIGVTLASIELGKFLYNTYGV